MKKSVKWLSLLLVSAAVLSGYPASASQTNGDKTTVGLLNLSSPNGLLSLDDDGCESFFEGTVWGKDDKLENCSSKQDILSAIKSNDTFSMEGTIVTDSGKQNITEYYDFSQMSKYDIAAWAYENKLITEEDKIDCYCDLVANRNFGNISCLTGVFAEVWKYSNENELSAELSAKIGKLLGKDDVSPNGPTRPGLYESSNFSINYDPIKVTQQEASNVASYMETIRNQFVQWGFKTPLLYNAKYVIILDSNASAKGYAGVTNQIDAATYSNTCATSITIYHFTTLSEQCKYTLAHEYFHAIQFSYNYNYNWFNEASSTAVSLIINNEKYEYHSTDIIDYIKNVDTVSLSSLPTNKGYGAAVFPLTIYTDFGGMSTIQKIYEEYNKHTVGINFHEFREVIDNGMLANGYRTGFNLAYRKMTLYILNSEEFYYNVNNTASSWTARENYNSITISTGNTVTKSGRANPLTSQYYKLSLPSNYTGSISIRIKSSNSSCNAQVYSEVNGAVSTRIGTTSFSYSVSSGQTKTILVVSNLSDSTSTDYTITIIPH